MKIICIGRNYVDHAKELNNPVPEKPVFFLKPDTAVLRPGYDFYYPDFSKDIHYELELVVKISKKGKYIQPQFASDYYEEVSLGLDLTARDLQAECKKKGLPWEIAKSFDHSCPMGRRFIRLDQLQNPIQNLDLELRVNGETRQMGNTKDMIFSVDQIIAYISNYITLKLGDLIFTGTPAGVGSLKIGDKLEGYLEGDLIFDTQIK